MRNIEIPTKDPNMILMVNFVKNALNKKISNLESFLTLSLKTTNNK